MGTYYGDLSSEKMNFCCMHACSFRWRVDHCIARGPRPLLRALFSSSWLILSSIKNCACVMELGLPVMVTMRFRVPGAKMPFFDIWMFAPLICWISTRERPPGPENTNGAYKRMSQKKKKYIKFSARAATAAQFGWQI